MPRLPENRDFRWAEARYQYVNGRSAAAIAAAMGLSRSSVYGYLRNDVPPTQRTERTRRRATARRRRMPTMQVYNAWPRENPFLGPPGGVPPQIELGFGRGTRTKHEA